MARYFGPTGETRPPAQQRRVDAGWRALGEQQQRGISLTDRLGRWAATRLRQQRAQARRLKESKGL